MKAIITGINGFVGSYLSQVLLEKNFAVFGLVRPNTGVDYLKPILNNLKLYTCELLDFKNVKKVLEEVKPDQIYHLAAVVQTHNILPREVFENNILSQLNLLEAVRELKLKSRILLVGTFREYGEIKLGESPIKENHPLEPIQSYGASKAAQSLMGYQYFKEFGLDIVRTRSFNHAGARRSALFVEGSLARQIAEIELGLKKPIIEVGNLDSRGDFSHVLDVCNAYNLLLEKGESGAVYNVASGKPHSIRQLLDTLLSFSKMKIAVKKDPSRFRETEEFWADITKLKLLGWKQKFSFESMLKETLNWWRAQIKQEQLNEKS